MEGGITWCSERKELFFLLCAGVMETEGDFRTITTTPRMAPKVLPFGSLKTVKSQ